MKTQATSERSQHKKSAGILLYQRRPRLQVLLAHPGGPFWRRKDAGAWTIPKGEIEEGEDALAAARREFEEETGHRPQGAALDLGSLRQPSGKAVHVCAIEDDWDPAQLVSNTFRIEWPPHSGRMEAFPEIDRAAWFGLNAARKKILKGQIAFLDQLQTILAGKT